MKTKLFFTMVVFVALTIVAAAQNGNGKRANTGQGRSHGTAWVDANNDGVCDNYVAGNNQGNGQAKGQGMRKGNCNGQCKAAGKGQQKSAGKGQARGNGQGKNKGQGPNFTDANKDGVCDNLQTIAK